MDPLKTFLEENRSEQVYGIEKVATDVRTAKDVVGSVIAALGGIALGILFFFVANKLIGIVIVAAGLFVPFMTYKLRKQEMGFINKSADGAVTSQATLAAVPQDETVADYVVGVMAVGMKAATLVVGSAGAMSAPQNVIVLTNQNVRFVYVPMPGADIVTSHAGNTVQFADFYLAHDEIETKLKSLLAEGGLQALANTSGKNYALPYADLAEVRTNMFGNVVFVTREGKKLAYTVRRKEDKEKLLGLLKEYVKA